MSTRKKIIDLSKLSDPESRMIGEILEIKNREVNKVMIPKNEVVALAYFCPTGSTIFGFVNGTR